MIEDLVYLLKFFSCPTCKKLYKGLTRPTTMPCGHTICLKCARVRTNCYACDKEYVYNDLSVNVTIREGSADLRKVIKERDEKGEFSGLLGYAYEKSKEEAEREIEESLKYINNEKNPDNIDTKKKKKSNKKKKNKSNTDTNNNNNDYYDDDVDENNIKLSPEDQEESDFLALTDEFPALYMAARNGSDTDKELAKLIRTTALIAANSKISTSDNNNSISSTSSSSASKYNNQDEIKNLVDPRKEVLCMCTWKCFNKASSKVIKNGRQSSHKNFFEGMKDYLEAKEMSEMNEIAAENLYDSASKKLKFTLTNEVAINHPNYDVDIYHCLSRARYLCKNDRAMPYSYISNKPHIVEYRKETLKYSIKSYELDPEKPESLSHLARCYIAVGEPLSAIYYLQLRESILSKRKESDRDPDLDAECYNILISTSQQVGIMEMPTLRFKVLLICS